MKLKTKILLPIFGVLILGFFVIGLIMYNLIYKQFIIEYVNHLETSSVLKTNHIRSFLQQISSEQKEIQSILFEQNDIAILDHPEWAGIISEKLRSDFDDYLNIHPEIHRLTVLGSELDIIFDFAPRDGVHYEDEHIPLILGYSSLDRMEPGVYFSDFLGEYEMKSLGLDNIDILISYSPIFIEEKLRGFVMLEIETKTIDDILLDRSGLGATGETYLVGRDGFMRSKSRFIDTAAFHTRVETNNYKNCFGLSSNVYPYEAFDDYRGFPVLGSYRYIKELDWCLLAEIDTAEALGPVKKSLFVFISYSMGFILLIYVFISIVVRFMISPISKLTKSMRMVERGNLEVDIDTHTGDEIGELSRSFQDVVRQIRVEDSHEKKTKPRKTKKKKIPSPTLGQLDSSTQETGTLLGPKKEKK